MADERQGVSSRFWTVLVASLLIASVVISVGYGLYLYLRPTSVTVRIAAGPHNGEIHELLEAVAYVGQRQFADLKIEIVTTVGDRENITLIEQGKVDLAAVSADIVTRPNLSLIAPLYPDLYQLIVRGDSSIHQVSDLPGHRIALVESEGVQSRSFWFLIGQYDISPESLTALPMSTREAQTAIVKGEIDAIFRTRAPRNRLIRWLIESSDLRLIAIDQGKAMKLRRPALMPTVIPKGTYAGSPPIPPDDLATVASPRLLLARTEVPGEAIRQLTAVLFEHRRDLLLLTRLAGFITQPDLDRGTFLPVHPGALSFYNREKPSALEEKAESLALLLSLGVVLVTSLLWLKRRWEASQKGRVDSYNLDLVTLCNEARATTSPEALKPYKERMIEMLARVVDDLDYDRVDGAGFQYFAFTWEAVNGAIADHERSLQQGAGKSGGKTGRSKTKPKPRAAARGGA